MQQIALVTLGVDDFARANAFYRNGFGWEPVFEQTDIAFYQMNGLVFAIWSASALADDMQRPAAPSGNIAMAHNVGSSEEVDLLIARLAAAGGTVMRVGDAPPHGGYPGYVSDPDGHAWEIAWNPAWPIDSAGHVRFSA